MDPSNLSPAPAPNNPQPTKTTPAHQYSGYSANSKNIKRFQTSQKMKNLFFVLIIGIPIVVGLLAYTAYRRYINPPNQNTESQNTSTNVGDPINPGVIDPNLGTQIPSTDPNIPSVPQQGPPSNPNTGGGQSSAPSGGIPDGVVAAINSIEQNGIKNNPYVAIDTSSIPDGTVVRIDRNSWSQFGPENGSVRGTISAFGQDRQGSLTFGIVSGSWKVVSYSIDA